MTTGIKGPTGPGGPTGPVGADELTEAAPTGGAGEAGRAAGSERAGGPGATDPLAALAAELDAGRITADDALARMIDEGLGDDLDPAQRAELESLFADLVAADPYLAGLARDLGGGPVGGGGDDGGPSR